MNGSAAAAGPSTTDSLVSALCCADSYHHPVATLRVLETHISWVILTGSFAYKIKKPVDLGFVDFSTLEKRRYYCHEELRLNRRLAPELYERVVAVYGTRSRPTFTGTGDPIEYAVCMRQFDQHSLLSRMASERSLNAAHIDDLAEQVARFHAVLPAAKVGQGFGEPAVVHRWVRENFDHIRPLIGDARSSEQLDVLGDFEEDRRGLLEPLMEQRLDSGYVRECHGDMHLGNMVLLDGRVTLFDCIEFNPELRWIDVMSEVAFVTMDLRDRGYPELSRRFLNAYLERTGDYEGVALLSYYLVYRALVRAKVSILRLKQGHLDAAQKRRVRQEYETYIALALQYAASTPAFIMITRGFSGSGKTTLSARLSEALGTIRIRSDVERKRMFGLDAEAESGSAPGAGIYAPDAGARTYERLLTLATAVVKAGYPALVDATFLGSRQRQPFADLAQALGVSFLILDLDVPVDVLRQRIDQRQRAGERVSEADTSVLERQLQHCDPLSSAERAAAVTVENADTPRLGPLLQRIKTKLGIADLPAN